MEHDGVVVQPFLQDVVLVGFGQNGFVEHLGLVDQAPQRREDEVDGEGGPHFERFVGDDVDVGMVGLEILGCGHDFGVVAGQDGNIALGHAVVEKGLDGLGQSLHDLIAEFLFLHEFHMHISLIALPRRDMLADIAVGFLHLFRVCTDY